MRTRRIPNAIPIALAVFGLGVNALTGWRGLLSAAAAGAILLVVGTVPFSLRLIGGGDIKLLAACASVFGLSHMLPLVVYTALLGGVLALAVALATGELRAVVRRAARAVAPQYSSGTAPPPSGLRLPYAVAIAGGVAWIALGETLLPALKIL